VGNPEEATEKIMRHSEALGGISRITFQMDVAGLSPANCLNRSFRARLDGGRGTLRFIAAVSGVPETVFSPQNCRRSWGRRFPYRSRL
jgi:hypothetical protein